MKKKLKLRREIVVNLSSLTHVVGAAASADTTCQSVCLRCSLFTCGGCATAGCTNPCLTIQLCTNGRC